MTDVGARDEETPRLSVIIPAFDVEDWIPLTLESISGQTMDSFEVLVVDDGSGDATRDVVEACSAADPRIRLLRNPGTGGAQARNHAISQARGEFLAFADADDVVPERAYELLLAQADASGNDMVIGSHTTIEPQRLAPRSASVPIYREARAGLRLSDEPRFLRDRVCWNRIIRRSTWERLGLRFSDARRSNDIQAMTRAYCMIPFDVIPESVYVYRRRVGSTSMTSGKLRPDALRDHFTQELGCADAVAQLGDKRVIDAYFAGILEFDVWAHGQEAALRVEPEFDQVRTLLSDLVSRASRDAVHTLPPHHQLFYAYVARGDWEGARICVGRQGLDMVESLEAADAEGLTRAALAVDRRSSRAAAWLVRASYLKGIRDEALDLDDRQLVALQRGARRLVRVGLPKRVFDWRERRILLADSSDPAAIRHAAQRPLPMGLGQVERVRSVLRRASQIGPDDAAPTPRQVLSLARRVRPRHVARASRIAAQAARRRLGR